jgi:pimeloyl-ACP methyl ester carboxylesterase
MSAFIFLQLLLHLLAYLGQVNATSLPPPSGPFTAGIRTSILAHTTPNDPVNPTGTGTSLLLTIYYPSFSAPKLQRYVARGLAEVYESYYSLPDGALYNISATYARNGGFLPIHVANDLGLPTLLFGPAAAGPPSQMFNALLTDLASHGYTVIAVDHPYEQPFLELPDGTGVSGLLPNETTVDGDTIHAYRLTDNSAVLDALPRIAKELKAPFDVQNVVLFGHSIGGSAALSSTLLEQNRTSLHRRTILGALNIDGSITGPAAVDSPVVDLGVPTLLLASSGHDWNDEPSYNTFVGYQTSWAKTIQITGNVNHTDFSDLVVWKQALGITGGGEGTAKANRVVQFARQFVRDFMKFAANGGRAGEGVLSGNDEVRKEWPEALWRHNGTGPVWS